MAMVLVFSIANLSLLLHIITTQLHPLSATEHFILNSLTVIVISFFVLIFPHSSKFIIVLFIWYFFTLKPQKLAVFLASAVS